MEFIDGLRKYIETTHAGAEVVVTRPLNSDGAWFFDIICGDKFLVVEWSLMTGFGVSSLAFPPESYGERPNESYNSVEDVQCRVNELLSEAR